MLLIIFLFLGSAHLFNGQSPDETCPSENEEYTVCGSTCTPTCEKNVCGPCIAQCVEGCFCKPGFIRQTENGPCVPDDQCQPPPCECPKNQVYTQCGSRCPPVCPGEVSRPCILICQPGCVCEQGFVANSEGVCLPCPPPKCPKNEVYKACGGCQKTCDNRNPKCTKECKKGCYCIDGYIRLKDDGPCIPEERCPKKCKH